MEMDPLDQWIFQVPVKGGRYYIITQLAVYTTYIPLIYCLLGDYIIPTTLYGNQKQPLIGLGAEIWQGWMMRWLFLQTGVLFGCGVLMG